MPTGGPGSPGEGVDRTTGTNPLYGKYCFRHLSAPLHLQFHLANGRRVQRA
jgi:hypothetical protein